MFFSSCCVLSLRSMSSCEMELRMVLYSWFSSCFSFSRLPIRCSSSRINSLRACISNWNSWACLTISSWTLASVSLATSGFFLLCSLAYAFRLATRSSKLSFSVCNCSTLSINLLWTVKYSFKLSGYIMKLMATSLISSFVACLSIEDSIS